jgi:hypothetical protein
LVIVQRRVEERVGEGLDEDASFGERLPDLRGRSCPLKFRPDFRIISPYIPTMQNRTGQPFRLDG